VQVEKQMLLQLTFRNQITAQQLLKRL